MTSTSVCRLCLGEQSEKDILNEKFVNTNECKSFVEVILFCLDIEVNQDSKLPTKICMKCYEKTVSFHKFKLLALKNDIYLKSTRGLHELGDIDCNGIIHIKKEDVPVTGYDLCNEENVKEETSNFSFHSEDESFDELKEIKYEYIEVKALEQETIKRKRGRPKKINDDQPIQKVCHECGKAVRNLKAHLDGHKSVKDGTYTSFKCDLCDKMFKTKVYLKKHMARKHLGNNKKCCKICNKMVSELKVHHLTVHDPDSLPYSCVSCGRRYITMTKLKQHWLLHTKDLPYQCDVCNKKFGLKIGLISHIQSVHDNVKPHLCQFCSKSFYKKYHLQLHLRTHTKEKPYSCTLCDKTFSNSTTLKKHQMIHANLKSYNCTLCDMAFNVPGYLRAHMRSHVKDKCYACRYCDVRFHRSDHRKRHEWTAHQRHLANGTS